MCVPIMPPKSMETDERGPSGAGKMLNTGKTHHCPYCAYITSNYAHLMRHLRTHTGEKPFACPHCPFRATQKDNLKRHIRTHTGEKPFACAHCSYTFAEKSSLKSHVWNHHSIDMLLAILLVIWLFIPQSNAHPLRVEVVSSISRTEEVEGLTNAASTCIMNFQCSYCSYNTPRQTHLKEHMLTHTGEKPHICPHCPFRSARSNNLKKHIRTHTGEKPFACSHCPYRSTRVDNLKAHILRHASRINTPSQGRAQWQHGGV
ncbi:zinc finger protein 513-like [Homarus americanus]|uniref:zinc finger protein 513-like n=1 Tax=Homarus americanus TaxID=6706 RepID=UPI001C47A2CE|nr:zinc finger protein 513-like [Homarus americanus]